MITMAQPEKNIRLGNCGASVFVNELQGSNGAFSKQTVVLQKHFKNKEGKDQYTNSYDLNDLFRLRMVIDKALEHLCFKEKGE